MTHVKIYHFALDLWVYPLGPLQETRGIFSSEFRRILTQRILQKPIRGIEDQNGGKPSLPIEMVRGANSVNRVHCQLTLDGGRPCNKNYPWRQMQPLAYTWHLSKKEA